jgi:hypothetical protein
MSEEAFGPAAMLQVNRIGFEQRERVLLSSSRNGHFGASHISVIGCVDNRRIRLKLPLPFGSQSFDLRN